MSRNDGKKHAFSENVSLVFNTEHSICKTPTPKFSDRAAKFGSMFRSPEKQVVKIIYFSHNVPLDPQNEVLTRLL